MRVLQVVMTIQGEHGGIPVICTRLAAAQAQAGMRVGLVSYPVPRGSASVTDNLRQVPGGADVSIHGLPRLTRRELYFPSAARAVVRAIVPEYDFVHIHAVWEPFLWMVGAEARRAGVPYCVVLHGLLDHWTLAQSSLKKRLALALRARAFLNHAAFLHVGNAHERDAIAGLGLTAPREIIPNGVFLEEFESPPPRGAFAAAHPSLSGRPYILFLSRIHFKKGLDFLADAFAIVARERPDVQLVVAGSDGGYQGEFERMIAAHGLTGRTHLVGALYGADKLAAFNDAACFCLPSRQEGFSIAITESLACGTPAVVSEDCHYPEVSEVRAGEVTKLDAASVAQGLLRVLAGDRAAMGEAGRRLVRERFNWPAVARTTLGAYERTYARLGRSVPGKGPVAAA
jgi:glycosyltransferase involved in cell wall biosynthesis